MPLFRGSSGQDSGAPNAASTTTRAIERARSRRYLVIGSERHGRGVAAYRWDKLPSDLNVADYDVVILNFAAFEDKQLAQGFPPDRLPSRADMARLVFSQSSEIIAIGDPSTQIGPPPTAERSWDHRKRADYWLPVWIKVEGNIGSSYAVLDNGLERILRRAVRVAVDLHRRAWAV